MKFKPIFCAFFCVIVFHVHFNKIEAQTRPTVQVLTPPPPEVSALGKFGLVPVSNFTGVPDVSFPVYTIKEGTLTFPVSLKYYAGGIKVKEDASEVGLGWALSAGGSITSSTRGEPDFPAGFWNTHVDMPDNPDIINTFKSPNASFQGYYYRWDNDQSLVQANSNFGSIYSGLYLPHNGTGKQYISYFQLGEEGKAPDFASDLYYITIGDRSYKFIFDNDFNPVVLGDGSLKIELLPTSGSYPDWKVTDEGGIVYYFTQRQLSSTSSSDPYFSENRSSLTVNTWHLTRIVSPVNGEINFLYLYNPQQFNHPLPSVSETYLVGSPSPHTQQSIESVTASFSVYEQLNISSITFSDGSVNFIYFDQRLDLGGARRLQSIEVKNKDNVLIRKIVLDNDAYFSANNTVGNGAGTPFYGVFSNLSQYTADNQTKRLKLKGILENDIAGITRKKTSFTYNESTNLPSKLSLSIDHWGYYNGAGNGQLVPPANIMLNGAQQSLTGADRNANPDYMQANMLTGITYPTGGTSNFIYETNQYKQQDMVTTYFDSVGDVYKASGTATVNYSPILNSTGSFTAGNWGGKRLGIFCLVDRHGTYPSNYDLNIVVYENGVFIKRITTPSSYTSIIDSSIVINAGSTYKFVFEPFTQDFFNNCEIRMQVFVKATSSTTAPVLNTYYSGGLRVSKISTFDPVSQATTVKKYTYTDGVPDDLPIYVSQEGADIYQRNDGTILTEVTNRFRYRYGQSIYPFSDGRDAAFFGYGKVQVSESDANNLNGMTEYQYNNLTSLNLNTALYYGNSFSTPGIINPILPVLPAITGGRGDITEEKYYVGSSLTPISMTHYYYDRDNAPKIWQFLFNQGLSSLTPDGQVFKIYAHQFEVPVFRNVLQRKEYFEYDQAGNTSLSTFESYSYDKLNGHYQLIKKSTGSSKSDVVNTYFKYPQDYPNLQSATSLDSISLGIKLLQQKHIILPLESYVERVINTMPTPTNQYFGGLLNIFNPDIPTLKQVQVTEANTVSSAFNFSSVTGGVFSKDAKYASRLRLKYDVLGRPIMQFLEKGRPTAYIWGSGLSAPLAQVVNASSNDVFFEGFEEGAGNVLNDSKTGKYSFNGPYTKTLNGLDAGSYIMSYWKKNAGSWSFMTSAVQVAGSTYTINLNAQVDDVRFYPSSAQMTTTTYLPLIGVTSSTDVKGQVLYYEYDAMQRLMNIRDKDFNIIKHVDYHYAGF
jgi:hypothetical protein